MRAFVHLAFQYHELLNTMHTHAGGWQDALGRRAVLQCDTCFRNTKNNNFCLFVFSDALKSTGSPTYSCFSSLSFL